MFTILRSKLPQNCIRLVFTNTSKKTYRNVFHSCQTPPVFSVNVQHNLYILRSKSKKSQKQPTKPTSTETESQEEDPWDNEVADKHTKLMEINVKSPRIDGVLKSGLGIARNKIETLFYESKIRVNGQKLLKKSDFAQEGDEIDVVKGANVNNPNFLTVARVEVLGIKEKGDNFLVKIRRCKSLTVENYDSVK